MITCCYHCKDRRQGCHSECETYAALRKQVDSARKEQHKDSTMRAWFYQRKTRNIKHMQEIQGKHIVGK